jgi:pimeloyl-ACP methyl ester carboxylesterase
MKLSVNGRVAYAYTGGKAFDASQPCVVLVHGASNDHSPWNLVARHFAHHGRSVLAVDLPGHGRSEGPPLESVEAMAHWLLALLDAAGVARAAFVGHSMGSLIALHAAGLAPERCTTLVMLGTAYPMKVSDALLATAAEAPERAMAMVNAWSFAGLASKPSFPGPGNWLHGANMALMRRLQRGPHAGPNLFRAGFEVCNRYAGGLEAAARMTAPTTLILGAQDQMTPPSATKELAVALQAEVVRVAGCGHHLLAEAPEATLAAMQAALAKPRGG